MDDFRRPLVSYVGPQIVGTRFEGLGIETPNATAILSNELSDASQAWFEAVEWQAGEEESDADIAAGRITRFSSERAFLDYL